MLNVCGVHQIAWVGDIYSDCPVCHLHKMVDESEQEIRELKAEVHRQAMELGKPVMVSVINQEALHVLKEAYAYIRGEYYHDHPTCVRIETAIANAERELKAEKEKV